MAGGNEGEVDGRQHLRLVLMPLQPMPSWTALNCSQKAAGEGVKLSSVPSSQAVTHPGAGGHVSVG